MTPRVDIAGEFRDAVERLRARGWDALEHLELTRAAVEAVGFVGLERVRGAGDGRYRPDRSGVPAVIVPLRAGRIYDAAGGWGSELVDLVAWIPNVGGKGQGDRLLTRLGVGQVLGRVELETAIAEGLALRLFRNPGSWAAAGAAGAVVLDWRKDVGLFRLNAIVAEDEGHAAEINRDLRRLRARLMPRLPDIAVIEKPAAERAA